MKSSAPATPGLSTPDLRGRGRRPRLRLVADAVTDVHPLQGPVEPLEVTPADNPVAGVAHVGGRLVSVLDPERLAGAAALPAPGETGRVGAGR